MRVPLTVVLCGLLAALGVPGAAVAAEPPESPPPGGPRLVEVDLRPADGDVPGTLVPAVLRPDPTVTVMLELEGEPVAVARADALRAGRPFEEADSDAVVDRLAARQARVAARARAEGATVLSTLAHAYNGIKVRAPRAAVDRLSALPGVRAVHDVPIYYPDNTESVPFLDVPAAVWQDLGLTGAGVSIGVIDSGIDYTHADFGGPGTEAAYEENDPARVERGSFPTAKVAGGVDLVGDAYDAQVAPVPNPDGDPLDCMGHGTHVAGTAAGYGVTARGETYSGPYAAQAYDEPFLVGPGVAPEATLYAIKVFGCEGGTEATVDALDWAVAADLDVVNLSLGSPFSLSDAPTLEAVANAAAAGVVVVASAGNSGPGPYITGFPASAADVLSVAAVDTVAGLPAADLLAGDEVLRLQDSNDAATDEPVTGPLVVLTDDPGTPADESLGCAAADYADVPEGAVVVTRRGICPRIDRAGLGQAAGAAAVVLVNDAPGLPPVEDPIPDVTIPFLGATPEQGERLRALAGEEVTVVAADDLPNPTFRQPADFTSAGPALAGSATKPDLAAPGVAITSAASGTGTGAVAYSGTSMASPHVAGAAALVRQGRPELDAADVRAALVGTADRAAVDRYATLRVGAGLVDPDAAVVTPVLALGDPGAATLSFGFVEQAGRIAQRRTVTLRNTGPSAIGFAVDIEADADAGGRGEVTVSPPAVTVPAGGTATVEVTVVVRAAGGLPADDVEVVSGTVVFRPTQDVPGVEELRVPYSMVPRTVAAVHSTPRTVPLPALPSTVAFRATNASPVPGSGDVYAWGLDDPAEGPATLGSAPDVRAVGVQAFPDVQPFPSEPDAQGVGVFAVHVADRLLTASLAEYDVLLDVDEDGIHDHAVIGVDAGVVVTGRPDGRLVSVTVELPREGLPEGRVIRALDAGDESGTSTLTLPFVLSDVGLDGQDQRDLTYTAAVQELYGSNRDLVRGEGSFDPYRPAVQTGQAFVVPGGGATSWSAAVHPGRVRTHPVLGWLVLHPQNASGTEQVDLVRLTRGRAPVRAPVRGPVRGPVTS